MDRKKGKVGGGGVDVGVSGIKSRRREKKKAYTE